MNVITKIMHILVTKQMSSIYGTAHPSTQISSFLEFPTYTSFHGGDLISMGKIISYFNENRDGSIHHLFRTPQTLPLFGNPQHHEELLIQIINGNFGIRYSTPSISCYRSLTIPPENITKVYSSGGKQVNCHNKIAQQTKKFKIQGYH